jgi:glycosyltransferase involved in cell wall biosynthesis
MRVVDIALVKADPIMASIRVFQIIGSLRKKYSIVALRWSREGNQQVPNNEESPSEAFNLGAPEYGHNPLRSLVFLSRLPIFWVWVFIKLCIYKPKVIHACNLDSVLPCYIYKVIFRKKLIFDVLDRFAMPYVPKNRNLLFKMYSSAACSIEETIAKNSEALLGVSDKIFITFRKKPKRCITIMNCCRDRMINKSRVETSNFKLLFTSHIRAGRGLESLMNIVPQLKDTELIIAGRMRDEGLLDKITGVPNIKYFGLLDIDRLLDLELSSDVLVALYDWNLQPIHKYGMANKILEAMMCGLPVITNIAHEIVNETGCGIIVEYGNEEQLKEAIVKLRDNPELRKRFGVNARTAYLQKYNWPNMEEKLFKIYEEMLGS